MWSTLEYSDPHHTPIDPPTNLENCQRMGIMATFRTFEEFEIYFSDLMNFFQPGDPSGLEGEMSPQDILAGSSVKLGSSFKDFMGEVKVRESLVWSWWNIHVCYSFCIHRCIFCVHLYLCRLVLPWELSLSSRGWPKEKRVQLPMFWHSSRYSVPHLTTLQYAFTLHIPSPAILPSCTHLK